MPITIFALFATLTFGLGDAFMIPAVMQPLFKSALGATMLDTLRLGPATAFYVTHIAGLVYFAGLPAVRGGSVFMAFVNGSLLGFVAYSCYEMTSWTIMRDWALSLVIIDLGWGTLISGISTWLGALAAHKFMRETRTHD